MKVVSTGSKFDIYPDDLKCYDELPAGYYAVNFSEKSGFTLNKYPEFKIADAKIYGPLNEKTDKVMSAFKDFNRSLGVILSGDKGIGKSLFSRILANEAIKHGMPVIIVDTYLPGIGTFIDSIEQEVLVLFDEFDKTFSEGDDAKAQTSLLSLFDGVSSEKRLYVITCNELYKINGFLVNRPGRFHYHFRFDYPTEAEIRKYLTDKLASECQNEINDVIMFSKRVALNYDCLRAIAFELNRGQCFSDAIKDLNIINMEEHHFSIVATLPNGIILKNRSFEMNAYSDRTTYASMFGENGQHELDLAFVPSHLKYNPKEDCLYLSGEDVKLVHRERYILNDDEEKRFEKLQEAGVKTVEFKRCNENNLHFAV